MVWRHKSDDISNFEDRIGKSFGRLLRCVSDIRPHAPHRKLCRDVSLSLTASKRWTTILELDRLVVMMVLFETEGQGRIDIHWLVSRIINKYVRQSSKSSSHVINDCRPNWVSVKGRPSMIINNLINNKYYVSRARYACWLNKSD